MLLKWRNWKMLLKETDETSYAIKYMAYPSLELIQHRPMTAVYRCILSGKDGTIVIC